MTAINVLVADDDPAVVEVVSAQLKSKGYNIACAANGIEAWKIYEDKNPDIVITDLNMPQMSGEELVRKIKKKSPRTIIIVLTGEGSMESAINVMRSGCDDYLHKPVKDPNRLLYVIQRSLERRDLLTRSLLQSRLNRAKSEYLHRLCDELSDPAHGLLTKTEKMVHLLEKSGAKKVLALANEIKGHTETLAEITGNLCDDCEKLKSVEK